MARVVAARGLSRARGYLSASPSRRSLQAHLLFISFATGLLDASTYSDFGIFASNQTGNSIIILVEAIASVRNGVNVGGSVEPSEERGTLLITVGVSLASFLLFGTIFGQIAARLHCNTTRAWLLFSTLVQSFFLLVPAILLQVGALSVTPSSASSSSSATTKRLHNAITILLLAASAGIQIAMSRSLSMPEIPTAMMTSVYADIIIDVNLFTPSISSQGVRKRNVRLAYVFMLALGTVVGALVWVYQGSTAVVWVAFALRMGNVALIAVAPAHEPDSGGVIDGHEQGEKTSEGGGADATTTPTTATSGQHSDATPI